MAVVEARVGIFNRLWSWKWRILVGLIVFGLTAVALWLNLRRLEPTTIVNPVLAPRSIIAQAGVIPTAQQKLSFRTAGTIKQIAVAVGSSVKAGDQLAKIDSTGLELKVEEARANLAIQTQTIIQSTEVAPADLNAARVALDSALARQSQVEAGASAGDVKAAEEAVAAARAGVASAQAQVVRVGAPASTGDVSAGEANIRSAQAQLASAIQKQNDARARPLAQDIAAANLSLEQSKNALWSQQLNRDSVCGVVGPNATGCHSADAEVAAAETSVKSAEANLESAKLPTTADELASAEADVTSATAALTSARDQLLQIEAGSVGADRDAAQAGLDQANANLRSAEAKRDQVVLGSGAADRESARSAVEQARANLAKLTADPTSATIELSKAKVHLADVSLAEAQLALRDATLVAPIDGIVTSIALRDGEFAGIGMTVLTIADLSNLAFETKDLDEISAAKVHPGQSVLVTIPALDKKSFEGTVTALASEPMLTASGDVNYVARITLSSPPADLRWGQTARVEFK